jgi:hypothetical protein
MVMITGYEHDESVDYEYDMNAIVIMLRLWS